MSTQQGRLELDRLRDRIAIVTGGGNNGIGWGIAKHAATELGMHVVILDLHENLVLAAQSRLSALAPERNHLGLVCDVTEEDSLASSLEVIQSALPEREIGAVFANAGVIFNHTLLKSTASEWSTTLNVNVLGVVNTIRTFVPVLQRQSAESVFCTTASIGGLVRGDGGAASYQASKHAVVATTEALSFELARRYPQIRVHVLCPCIVASGLGETSRTNAQVATGELSGEAVVPLTVSDDGLAMSTEQHAQQVFDQIEAGNFYMITDNVRPYVDHDYPFDGLAIVRERFENMMRLQLNNQDAFGEGSEGPASSILKGPLFEEIRRRRRRRDA